MTRYAESTSVTPDASRAEIERILMRYGASQFIYGWDATRAVIGFQANGRQVRFVLPMPDRADPAFTHTPGKNLRRSDDGAYKEWEQAVRQRWRALALVIKAKLEAVTAGIVEFEREFLAHIVLPDGSNVGDFMLPQIASAYDTGAMPQMLPELESPR